MKHLIQTRPPHGARRDLSLKSVSTSTHANQGSVCEGEQGAGPSAARQPMGCTPQPLSPSPSVTWPCADAGDSMREIMPGSFPFLKSMCLVACLF